jgi:hypothetical protein
LPLHSGTFYHSNPAVPEYGLHDIARIGSSKAKLADLVDREIFRLEDLPTDLELTAIQRNQVDAYLHDRILIRQDEIAAELRKLVFPGYFLDYETCPAAVPRFDGYSPYQQIPFQYSLHVLDRADGDPRHEEFLSTTPGDPSAAMCASLQKHIGSMGSVVVWNKKFECTINRELSERIPAAKAFLDSLNGRVYDLMDVFSKQLGELFLRVVKPGRNGFQRRRPWRGVIGENHVNVHGKARHLLEKKIDCGSALHGEMRRLENGRRAFQQKADGINVRFFHHGLIVRVVPLLN